MGCVPNSAMTEFGFSDPPPPLSHPPLAVSSVPSVAQGTPRPQPRCTDQHSQPAPTSLCHGRMRVSQQLQTTSLCQGCIIINNHHQYLNREGRWGTTDDFATTFHIKYRRCRCVRVYVSRPVHPTSLCQGVYFTASTPDFVVSGCIFHGKYTRLRCVRVYISRQVQPTSPAVGSCGCRN